ncbi:MAG: DivIVA domain-containing protein [Actinobacteria bacterium]|nr:DivIVA domain-containing protein [Actinomycetota bacterium]
MADDEVESDDWPDEADEPRPEDDSGGLSPEDVAYRSFKGAKRGISESEVREFLQEVAGELAAAVGRERDLLAQIHQREEHIHRLEERIAHPPPPTEEEALDYLGEETARVLRSAQEAADEIRSKAGARARAIIGQGENDAARMREAAHTALSERSREAEVAATVTLHEAEGRAQAVLRQAARDAETEIEAARQRGREMVGEARAVRERILADLGKRRSALQGELAQLEAAREELLESGRAMRQQLADAVQALTPFDEQKLEELHEALEELAPDETAEPGPEESEEEEEDEKSVAAWPALELVEKAEDEAPADEAAEEEEEEEAQQGPEPDVPDFVAPEPEVPDFVAPAVGAEPERPKVDELFARIRAGRQEPVGEARVALAPEPAEEEKPPKADVAAQVEPEPEPEPEPPSPVPLTGDTGLLSRRDEVLAPVRQELLRRCKRALQDEQNELLDRLRRERGRTNAEQLLAPLSAQVTDWADVLEPAVDEAYGAGRGSQTADEQHTESAPRRLVSGLAEVLVTPLRERLVSTLGSAEGDGAELEAELSARVGARYREWRAQELEYRVGDVLAAAYARGVYDAAPEGSQLRWVPAQVGQCPDADDNALEPTTRGSTFPTGQPLPPAHPGCRCLIAVADTD